jgi:hypothetical protein
MAIIIANENGDWWQVTKAHGKKLWVLDTSKVTGKQALIDIAEYAWIDLDSDEATGEVIFPEDLQEQIDGAIFASDKLEKLAWEYGSEITIDI